MDKEKFIKLLENAKQDKYGNLYYVDDSIDINNRVYFGTITTICDDFVKEYCYKGDNGHEYYNRHFTCNDDTIEIYLVKSKKLRKIGLVEKVEE